MAFARQRQRTEPAVGAVLLRKQGAGRKGAGRKGAGRKGADRKGANGKGAHRKGADRKGANGKGAHRKGAGLNPMPHSPYWRSPSRSSTSISP
ncbi:hypothetical protein F1599_18185 [Cupriavidus cauae]|uniref:Uncharacterized protein n=1 Tax=Cupriavidus cauae TaxID=2608999 RepID=A0A5M8ADL1_9BURK|nr:hypothetical protein F1599_18185 [Cupriavidus cauae]